MTYIEDKTEEELVDDIGRNVIGTPSGLNAQFSQAELTRRLLVGIEDLNKATSRYSKIIIILTIVLGVFAIIQIGLIVRQILLTKEQTQYAKIQSIPEQINQLRANKEAVEFCKENPNELSKLVYLEGINEGKTVPCSDNYFH